MVAGVAQSVVQLIRNQQVASSSLVTSSKKGSNQSFDSILFDFYNEKSLKNSINHMTPRYKSPDSISQATTGLSVKITL